MHRCLKKKIFLSNLNSRLCFFNYLFLKPKKLVTKKNILTVIKISPWKKFANSQSDFNGYYILKQVGSCVFYFADWIQIREELNTTGI